MGTIIDNGRYLWTSIPTIGHCNLSSWRKSQHANHALMEIRNIHAINYNATMYLCTRKSIERGEGSREVVNTIIFCRIHCNFGTIVNSLSFSHGFSQFEFSRKNLLFSPVYWVEIFNYYSVIKTPSRLWYWLSIQSCPKISTTIIK